ncbi:MAG: hypothetical protein FD167_4630 [bacterium]|nr:MAG: hypothetical protein FD167_4630 [bacterium]
MPTLSKAPERAQQENFTLNEAKTQRSIIEHSLTPTLLEQLLNAWYEAKEARQQQRLAEAQASPDQQYLYTSEENGYRYTYQVSIKLVNTAEILLVSLLQLDSYLDNKLNELDNHLDNNVTNALELNDQQLEMEVSNYVN